MDGNQRRALTSWIFLAVLASLSLTLGIVQYRWIGEVSQAEHERLKGSLQAAANRVAEDFDRQLAAACAALVPNQMNAGERLPEGDYLARYQRWIATSQRTQLFRRIALVEPVGETLTLRLLDQDKGEFHDAEWPPAWYRARERMTARFLRHAPGVMTEDYEALVEIPNFNRRRDDSSPVGRELGWLLLELNLEYLRTSMVPELLRRQLGNNALQDYNAEIVMWNNPSLVIFDSDPKARINTAAEADASAAMFELRGYPGPRRGPFGSMESRPPSARMKRTPERARSQNFGRPMGGPPSPARWRLMLTRRDGSLESLVAKTRLRNLAVSSAILIMIVAAAWALMRYTRRAQRLAELQMEFVAGVSHELRTPLSVMRTAGHNLQGKVSDEPERVRRYGALIADESERLTAIVEQVLSFSNARAGRIIGAREPVTVESLIDEAIAADRRAIESSGCLIEKNIDAELRPVLGDRTTLRHAFQNLLSNAAKYGKSGRWIGISGREGGADSIEIRITDHGEGIPEDEIPQIFEPFFRGRQAVAGQIHGTGLGLSLVKRIIEAHGGGISVTSESGRGTEFLVRLPIAAPVHEHEFADSSR